MGSETKIKPNLDKCHAANPQLFPESWATPGRKRARAYCFQTSFISLTIRICQEETETIKLCAKKPQAQVRDVSSL